MSTTFFDRYRPWHCSHILHLFSPRDGQQACSHPAPVSRELWMMLLVKWTFLRASLRRTDENSHDPCPVPSAPLPKAVVSSGAFGANAVVCQPLSRYRPVAMLGGLEVSQCLSAGVCSLPAPLPGCRTWQQRGLSPSRGALLSVQQLQATQPGQRPASPH